MLDRVQEQETFNIQIIRDHVDLACEFEAEERKLQEEIEAVRLENLQLRQQIVQVSSKTQQAKKEAQEEYERNAEEF